MPKSRKHTHTKKSAKPKKHRPTPQDNEPKPLEVDATDVNLVAAQGDAVDAANPGSTDDERIPLADAVGQPKPRRGGKGAKKNGKAPKARKTGVAAPKRLSGLDAAAKVLTEASEPMSAKAIIQAMTDQGLWTSPGGRTPHATIYSAMLREIAAKGKEARFRKVDRGRFVAAN